MVKFFMKCFLLTTVLLFGILLGMQQANKGMKEMQGYNDPSIEAVIQVKEKENGENETAVLGETVMNQSLEEKMKDLEKIESFNLFSTAGKKLSEGVSFIFENIIQLFSKGIDLLLGVIVIESWFIY